MSLMKVWAPIIALCGCLAVAGCGGGGDSASGSPAAQTAATESAGDEPGPEVRVPAGPPPKKVVVRDLRKGSGAEAKRGYEVTLRYVGVHWSGKLYSNSWTYDEPPRFLLGGRELTMPGLDEGIRGMRVGGRREIIVPPRAQFRHGALSLNQTFVFVVDMLKARPAYGKLHALNG
jgi:FKBP-type peptidyl-prolyl cis-trans isomerase